MRHEDSALDRFGQYSDKKLAALYDKRVDTQYVTPLKLGLHDILIRAEWIRALHFIMGYFAATLWYEAPKLPGVSKKYGCIVTGQPGIGMSRYY